MKTITTYAQLKKDFPKISVKGIDQKNVIEEQEKYINKASFFVTQLSLNRYLARPLLKFTQVEKVDLLKTLFDKGFFLHQAMFPPLYPSIPTEIGFDIFRGIVKVQGYTEETSIGKCLILNQIFGKGDLREAPLKKYYDSFQSTTIDFLETNFKQLTVGSTVGMFILDDGFVSIGDHPCLHSIIGANRALLARDLAKLNIQKLEKRETRLYDISYLL